MRLGTALRFSTLFVTTLCPVLLRAQFQEPTKEELQMTSDPKAPGAAAVYLNIKEVTDDPMHYHSFYARIKVLQEKGKELATVELPYLRGDTKVTDVRGRTIHPDGTVIPLTGKPEDLLISKTKDSKGDDRTIGKRVFTLPSVEVGSVIEYTYALRYDDNHYSSPWWHLQHPYFVHKEHYAFTPFKAFLKGDQNATSHFLVDVHGNVVNSLIYSAQLPEGAKVIQDAQGHFSIDLDDIPAIPDEDYMPPINSFLYHIFFYYKSAHDGGDFWVTEAKRWSKEVDHFAEPTKPIREAVAQLIAPSDSEIDKAKKLYNAVQQLDNTDFSREKGKSELKQLHIKAARRAEDTWAQKSGDSHDIALLYIAMLRAAGLTAYDMKVVNRENGIFNPGYLEFDQLDDDLVIAKIGGKEILLDPGEKMCPFQLVHWSHSSAGGVRESADGRAAAVTPDQVYTDNSISRVGDVKLEENGAMKANFTFIMTGQEALYWRQQALLNDQDEVKKKFDRALQGIVPEGVEAHIDHFLALDDASSNLMAMVKAEGVLGTATSKRMLLPGFFFEAGGHRPFVDQEKRQEPVDMHFSDRETEQVTYNLPAGVTVEGSPQENKIPWESHAVLSTKVVSSPGKIISLPFTGARVYPGESGSVSGPAELLSEGRHQRSAATGALDKPGAEGTVMRFLSLTAMVVAVGGLLPAANARDKMLPVPQWAVDAAKTATPASAKDSPAVVLYDEYLITVDAQNRAVERERVAVRILKPQGRAYSHCAISYDIDQKLNYFRSWTVTPDGRQLQAMETDFVDHGAYAAPELQFTERIREVRPPASDPGAVVVCETEEQLRPYMNEEEWEIQTSIPVVFEAFELALPPGGRYADSWRRHEPIKPSEVAPNHLRWEVKDMPALDLENIHATPQWSALAARASVKWGDAAVKGTDNQWKAIGLWQEQLEQHRPDPTPEITAKTQELVAGAPDLYTKLSRITGFIQKNIRYFVVERGIGGWQAHYAGDIYRNRYGDCKDKTTLLISMLQVVGVRAYYFHVDSRRGVIDPDEPSLVGNHMITAIELPEGDNDPRLAARVKAANGKTLLIFDPTDEVTPVGLIRSDLQGAYGNISNGEYSQVLRMPVLSPEFGGLCRKGSFTLTADGTLTGDINEQFLGDEATSQRWFLKENDSRELHAKLEKRLGSELPGLAFKGFEFSGSEQLDHPLNLDLHISAAGYAHSSGPLLLLRPRVLGSHAMMVPDVMAGKDREYPIELGHPGRWRDSYDIAIPDGYVVDDMPAPVDVDVDFASYHASVSAKGKTLHYESEYVVREIEIPPSKAASFRKLESAIVGNEKGAAVLKKE